MSLRTFHVVFIVIVILAADLFGLWAVLNYASVGDATILTLGIASILGGLGLIAYLVRLIRSLDAANIH